MKQKWLTWLLVTAMIVTMFPSTIFAEGDIEASFCTCTAKCTENSVDTSCLLCTQDVENCIMEEPEATPSEATVLSQLSVPQNVIYVSADAAGNTGSGAKDSPYGSLSEAIKNAQSGATIYIMSGLELHSMLSIWEKNVTIASDPECSGSPFTISRGAGFATSTDSARGNYNPAMIEVGGVTGSGVVASLTLENIIFDDGGKHEGSYFVQADSEGDGQTTVNQSEVENTAIAQDAIIATYNGTGRITLGDGTVLRNFGGMSAVRISGGELIMEAGSKIEDTTVTDREKGASGSNGPAGAVWIQGGKFTMNNDAVIHDIIGRAVYIDGGKSEIGGTIQHITGDADMWNGFSGTAIHIRNKGWAVLKGTGVIDTITGEHAGYRGAVMTNGSRGADLYDFEMEPGSVIRNVTGFPTLFSNYGTELLNGTIESCTNDYIIGGLAQNTTIGKTGIVQNCTATAGDAKSIVYTSNASQIFMKGTMKDNNVGTAAFYIINQSGGGASLRISEGAVIQGTGSNYGVYINASESQCIMDGGIISGFNYGVYCRGKNNRKATFIMNGGTITENTCGIYFGGISNSKSVVDLLDGNIVGNGSDYSIYALGGNSCDDHERILINSGVLQGNTAVKLSLGTITLDEDYGTISLGTAANSATTRIKEQVAEEKGQDWTAQISSALWFKPTEDTFHFTLPRPDVDNILYAAYIPLNADGTPSEEASLNMIQLDVADTEGYVTLNDTLDIHLTNLTANQPYAFMLIKSPNIIIRPIDLAKYVTGDDKHDGENDTNCFPDPRYSGIPQNAVIIVSGTVWNPSDHNDTPYPFTINYYEQDGITQIIDDHKPGNYIAKVEILPGLGTLPDNITINGQKVYFGTGNLSIRAVSNASSIENIEESSSKVVTVEPTAQVVDAVAVIPDGISYLVNGIDDQKPNDGADIRLLHDELIADAAGEDQYVDMLRKRIEDEFADELLSLGESDLQYAMKYLDFIDANDSNIIVTPKFSTLDVLLGKAQYSLYLPYPSGTNMVDHDFLVFDFSGLDRTYTESDYGPGVEDAIHNSTVEMLNLEKTDYGIKVTVKATAANKGHLGAMALVWTQNSHAITATAGNGGIITPSGNVKVRDTGSRTFTIIPDNGYHIKDVQVDGKSVGAVETYTFDNVTTNHTIFATFASDSSGGSTNYTLTASAGEGGSISPNGSVRVNRGSDKTFAITPDEGYQISDILVDGESVGAVSSYTFENVKAGHTIEALFRAEHQIADPDDTGVSAWLNTKEHDAYLHGYTDGSFGPGHNMTRAEAAQMFYNLLLDQDTAKTASFDDVASDAWYADAVNTLASIGILQGVGGSRFAPERSITRAEFTAIAMRFAKLDTRGEASFSDVSKDDWFYGQVVGAVRYGWITGYEDGTFRPNHTITRAEAAVLTNRLLARSPDERYVDAHSGGIRQFSDMTSGHWAYYPIMEAANSHDYEKTANAERWLQTEP